MSALSRPILRYHGGKWRLAPWIISHFPPHRTYVEPFGGAASVLLRKKPTWSEVYNDLDGEIVNLFRVARDRGPELVRAIALTPYSRAEFDSSFRVEGDDLERARKTVVRSFLGFGGNLTRPNRDGSPQRTGFRSFSTGSRRAIPAVDWRNWPDELSVIIDRLRGVVIEERDALELIYAHDSADTLFYVDPPYVHSTRSPDCGGTHRGYRFEMDDQAHRDLATVLHSLVGMVVLSGYGCELYDSELYAAWQRHERKHLADGARERTEVVWLNRACVDNLRHSKQQHSLFHDPEAA